LNIDGLVLIVNGWLLLEIHFRPLA